MAAARRAPPLYAVNRYMLVGNSYAGKGGKGWAEPDARVGNGNLTGRPEEGWRKIEIARREAYGCDDNMRAALDGLGLCMRLGDDPLVTSELGLRVSRDARERFISEIGVVHVYEDVDVDEEAEVEPIPATARILMQEQGLLIIFLLLERGSRILSYYLVYDRSDASLSLISWARDSIRVLDMFRPLPKRTSNGAYELFLLGCDAPPLPWDMNTNLAPFLCVFSPVTGTNRTCAWEMRRTLKRGNLPARFRTDTTFSFQGKGFWADLSQALIYGDLHAAGDGSGVDFGCIDLPGECQLDLGQMLDSIQPMKATRTIACVGDSIWFVCVRHAKHHADDLVTMWTLELPGGQWKNEARFPVRELWRFDGFKEAGLPEAKVGYPVLTTDGALCLVVTGQTLEFDYSDVSYVDHICTFDVGNKRLLWHGSVHDHTFTQPVALPPDFFPMNPLSHKRKLDELCPAAGPGFAARE